jgi:23S rRNA (cytosine1962-C5)-methyltransferase
MDPSGMNQTGNLEQRIFADAATRVEMEYELVDFGDGRKLERFAGRLIDRPSPAAVDYSKIRPDIWSEADSVFDASAKTWRHRTPWPEDFELCCGSFVMPLSPRPFGHLGVFPEQDRNWKWLVDTAPDVRIDASDGSSSGDPQRLPAGLNLFAYTGASTMAMASSGIRVAHVDAAKPNVAAARVAAERNGFNDHPIRYLVDDAAKFAAREVRRERLYQTIVLDPPAYGHSPRGKAWRLERDLWPLLDDCLQLLSASSFRLLITGHSPQVGPDDVVNYLLERLPSQRGVSRNRVRSGLESGRLVLPAHRGRTLDAGHFVRLQFAE